MLEIVVFGQRPSLMPSPPGALPIGGSIFLNWVFLNFPDKFGVGVMTPRTARMLLIFIGLPGIAWLILFMIPKPTRKNTLAQPAAEVIAVPRRIERPPKIAA